MSEGAGSQAFGPAEVVPTTTNTNGDAPRRLSAADLADKSRFRFREIEVDLTEELGGAITLRTLSVEERETLPGLVDMQETDDKGLKTKRAIRAAAETFAVIVSDPKVSADEAETFLGSWPAEAFDKVTTEFGKLVADGEEESRTARDEFPEGEREA